MCDKCGSYSPIGTKTIKCIDCGKEFEVDGIVKKQKRCEQCKKIYNNLLRMKNYYIKKYNDGYVYNYKGKYFLTKENVMNFVNKGYKIIEVIYPDEDSYNNRYPYLLTFCSNENSYQEILYEAKLIEIDFM